MFNITLHLTEMTWGELRQFVELGAGEDAEAMVGLDFDSNAEVIGLSILSDRIGGTDGS